MFCCHVCGATESSNKLVREVFDIDGRPVLVEISPLPSVRIAVNLYLAGKLPNEFGAWSVGKLNRSGPSRWTYLPSDRRDEHSFRS